jgi:hypothetical protein
MMIQENFEGKFSLLIQENFEGKFCLLIQEKVSSPVFSYGPYYREAFL